MSKFPKIDRSKILILPNAQRESKVHMSDLADEHDWYQENADVEIDAETRGLADAIRDAKDRGRPVIFFISGHVIKHGLSAFIASLVEEGYITHVACNGSVMIHDWELVYANETSEDVGKYITDGKFGHWRTPGLINDIVYANFNGENTIGEILGQVMAQEQRGQRMSLIRCCHDAGIPMTFHVLIGGDIIHQHPNCDASMFAASYQDFLVFGGSVQNLEGGVFVNVGSQVTGTEVFLKALSMARNIAPRIDVPPPLHITTGMLDFVQLPENWRDGEASEGDAAYYYRPWKSILLRTVADGGQSFYVGGQHTETVPKLWKAIIHG